MSSLKPRGMPPLDRTLTDQMVRQVRKMIILGELAPGERLMEVKLAESFGVSRSTVREVLRKLEAENLVITHPHRGSRVTSIDLSDAQEICELHALLEEHTIEQLELPLGAGFHEHLSRLVVQMEMLRLPEEIDRFIDLDHDFHRTLVTATGRQHLLLVWSTVSSLLNVLLTLSIKYRELDAHLTAKRHQVIVDALIQGDRELAVDLIGEHYRSLVRHFHPPAAVDAD